MAIKYLRPCSSYVLLFSDDLGGAVPLGKVQAVAVTRDTVDRVFAVAKRGDKAEVFSTVNATYLVTGRVCDEDLPSTYRGRGIDDAEVRARDDEVVVNSGSSKIRFVGNELGKRFIFENVAPEIVERTNRDLKEHNIGENMLDGISGCDSGGLDELVAVASLLETHHTEFVDGAFYLVHGSKSIPYSELSKCFTERTLSKYMIRYVKNSAHIFTKIISDVVEEISKQLRIPKGLQDFMTVPDVLWYLSRGGGASLMLTVGDFGMGGVYDYLRRLTYLYIIDRVSESRSLFTVQNIVETKRVFIPFAEPVFFEYLVVEASPKKCTIYEKYGSALCDIDEVVRVMLSYLESERGALKKIRSERGVDVLDLVFGSSLEPSDTIKEVVHSVAYGDPKEVVITEDRLREILVLEEKAISVLSSESYVIPGLKKLQFLFSVLDDLENALGLPIFYGKIV